MSYYPPLDEDSSSTNADEDNVSLSTAGLGFGILDQSMTTSEDYLTSDSDYVRPPYNPQATVSQGNLSNDQANDLASPTNDRPQRPPRPPPPKRAAEQMMKDEILKDLTVPQVRWFYKDDITKKWQPFIGYDSCQLEYKYRQIYVHGDVPDEIEKISVRGGLFEVDIIEKKCCAIYWSGESMQIDSYYYILQSMPKFLNDFLLRQYVLDDHVWARLHANL